MDKADCSDLNHRDYIDRLVKGAITLAIAALEADIDKEALANLLRLARHQLAEVLEARAAPSPYELIDS
ncbi:MAG TPA: hypothetical protein VMF64_08605 [Steroidobacteraceae bacterium]|nr:hypothetical protein [Steroidobacteraceae bacterium]